MLEKLSSIFSKRNTSADAASAPDAAAPSSPPPPPADAPPVIPPPAGGFGQNVTRSLGTPLRPLAPVSLRPPTKMPLSNVPQGTANTTTTFTRVKKRITQRIAPPVNLPVQSLAPVETPGFTSDHNSTPAPVEQSLPPAPVSASGERMVVIPMSVALDSLPLTVLADQKDSLLARPEVAAGLSLPLNQVFGMLPSGKIEFSLKDFAPFFPPGFLKPVESHGEDEQFICKLPLEIVVGAMSPDFFKRRNDQKPIDKRIVEMSDPFVFNTIPSPAPITPAVEPETPAPDLSAPVESQDAVAQTAPVEEAQPPVTPPSEEVETPLPPILSEIKETIAESEPLKAAEEVPVYEPRSEEVAPEKEAPAPAPAEPDFSFLRNEAFKALLAEEEAQKETSATQDSTPVSEPVPVEASAPEEPAASTEPELPNLSAELPPSQPPAHPTVTVEVKKPFKPNETATIKVKEDAPPRPKIDGSMRESFAKELSRLAEKEKASRAQALLESGGPEGLPAQLPPMELPSDELTSVVKLRKTDPPPPMLPPISLPEAFKPVEQTPSSGLIPIQQDLAPVSKKEEPKEETQKETKPVSVESPINLNACTEDELVGRALCPEALARKIIAWRELYGPFSEPSGLWHVPGMTAEVYGSLVGLPAADHVVSQELQEAFGGSAASPLTIKTIVSRIRHWPFMTGCIIGGMEGLPIAYDCEDESFAKTICAFLPRLIARTNETLSEVKEPETDEIFICKGDKSLFLFRSGPVLLLAVNRRKDISARDAELLRRVTAYLGEMNKARVTT